MTNRTQSLTAAQRRTLIGRAGHWALVIQRFGQSSLDAPADPENFHSLGVAFTHLHRCLELLKNDAPEPVGSLAIRFRDQCADAKLRDLRVLLEHEEEYLIGNGREPKLVGRGERPWDSDLGRVDWGITGTSSVETIGMFDRSFHVGPPIETAQLLVPALHAWWKTLA
jgi:hypothetical protein